MKDKYIIIDKTQLENIFLRYEKSDYKWLYRIMSLSGSAATSLLLSIFTTKQYQGVLFISEHTSKSLIAIATVTFGVTFFITLIIWGYLKFKGKLEDLPGLQDKIIGKNLYTEDFTYILLFPKYVGKKMLFPVMQKDTWDNSLFFPYLKHNYGNDSISLHKKEIADEIRTKYSIPIPINIKEVDTDDSIVVKLKDGLPKNFHFKFLYISSLSPFFIPYLCNLLEDNGFKFLSLEDISSDRITAINNGKVLSIIENNKTQIKKIYDEVAKMKSKIIWNIDKSCSNKCSICAYGNEQTEARGIDELKGMVESIASLDITNIDLSMGDGANVEIIKEIILYIKKNMESSINLTATAKLLSQFPFEFLNSNIAEIEITYDYPHTLLDKKDLRPTGYNKQNYDFVKELIKKKFNFKVSVNVILHENITQDIILAIHKNLKKIRINKYNFLRLMPLGNITYSFYPAQLQKKKFYLDISNAVMSKNPHIHCALSCAYSTGTVCRMGISKLGISPTGDVYTCAWAEHIRQEITNPFLIGNIEDYDDLRSMLIGNQHYLENISRPQSKDCKIFSYMESGDLWSQSDKLFRS